MNAIIHQVQLIWCRYLGKLRHRYVKLFNALYFILVLNSYSSQLAVEISSKVSRETVLMLIFST